MLPLLFRSISSDDKFDTTMFRQSPTKQCANCRTPTPTPERSPTPVFAQVFRNKSPNPDVLCSPKCLKHYQFKRTPNAVFYSENKKDYLKNSLVPYQDFTTPQYHTYARMERIQNDLQKKYEGKNAY